MLISLSDSEIGKCVSKSGPQYAPAMCDLFATDFSSPTRCASSCNAAHACRGKVVEMVEKEES
eukprot:1161649-Pelagomonas_calceolata.AAC.6